MEEDEYDNKSDIEICSVFGHPSSSVYNEQINPTDFYMRTGKIIKMHLKNFMCHSNLVIDFNDRINILVGNNGSGKSAILSALIIGLGKSANIASRSSNIKQLIKRGAPSATIEIHLNNKGPEGFDKAKLHDKIIIVRHITAGGGSNYKIKDADGTLYSTNFSDLQRILMYMNIQVENPVCVLNQEASRTFLKDTDSKKRFQLFRKATQIETIINILNDCTKLYESSMSQLKNICKNTEMVNSEINELREKHNKLMSAKTLKDHIAELTCELSWIKIIDVEEKMTEIERQIKTCQSDAEKLHDVVKNRDIISTQLKQKLKLTNTDYNLKQEELQESIKTYDRERKLYLDLNTELMSNKRSYIKCEEKIKLQKRDIVQLERDIEERSDSHQTRNVDLKKQNKEKLKIKEKEVEDGQLVIATAMRDIQHFNNNLEGIQNNLDSINENRVSVQNKKSQITTQIRQIDVKNSNSLVIYGNQMPKFLETIEAEFKRGSFSEMPRGPLGRYIEVPDSKWQSVIEQIFGGILQSFSVSTQNDSKVLNNLLKKFPGMSKFSIIVGKFVHKMHDVRSGMVNPPQNTVSLLHTIKVADPIVMNVLIDQLQIDRILLTEKSKTAQYYTDKVQKVPKNLSRIYVLQPFAEYCPAPQYRSYSSALRQSHLLQTNMVQFKRQLEKDAAEINSKLEEINKEFHQKQLELTNIKTKINDKKKEVTKIEKSIHNLLQTINEIKSIEYPAENEVEVLMKELHELQISLKQNEEKITEERQKYKKVDAEKKKCEEKTNQINDNTKEIEMEIENLKRILSETKNELQMVITTSSYSENELKNLKIRRTHLDKEHKTIKTNLSNLLKNAGERIDTDRIEEDIINEINKLESQIRTICAITDDINDIKELLDEKISKAEHTKEVINKTEETMKVLLDSKIGRFQFFKRFQQHMSLRVKQKFNAVMKVRQYVGNLNIDFSTQKLDLSVIPQDKNILNAVSNTKSLSGGERSFSTLAFLLALWSCVDNPFYCLDEYDVFTDQLNQQIMAKLLINEAEKKEHRQFLFLTPLNMSFINETPNITFHKLDDPR